MVGVDANARVRSAAIEDVRGALISTGWIDKTHAERSAEDFASVLEDTRVDHLTEFGRAVHAEMAAILDAARRGAAVRGASLFTTTFPCHNCAKHIVGAGLKRVIYIAPYPKSLAEELHPDSISLDPRHEPSDRVIFRPFVGIAPFSYLPIFQAGSRRKLADGRAVEFDALKARPKLVIGWDLSYLEREDVAMVALGQSLEKHDVELVEGRGLPDPTLG